MTSNDEVAVTNVTLKEEEEEGCDDEINIEIPTAVVDNEETSTAISAPQTAVAKSLGDESNNNKGKKPTGKSVSASASTSVRRKKKPQTTTSASRKSSEQPPVEDVITAAARASGVDIRGLHQQNQNQLLLSGGGGTNSSANTGGGGFPSTSPPNHNSRSMMNTSNNNNTSPGGRGGAGGGLPGYAARSNRKPTIGGRLAQSRIAAGINQHEVASKCGVAVNKIFQIEKGQDEDGLERYGKVLAHIAIALGVPFVELFGDYLAVTTNPHVVDPASQFAASARSSSMVFGSTSFSSSSIPPSQTASADTIPPENNNTQQQQPSPSSSSPRRIHHLNQHIPPWKLTVGGRVKHFREGAKVTLDQLATSLEDIFLSIYGYDHLIAKSSRTGLAMSQSFHMPLSATDRGTSNKNLKSTTSASSAKNLKKTQSNVSSSAQQQQQQQPGRPLSPSLTLTRGFSNVSDATTAGGGSNNNTPSGGLRPTSPGGGAGAGGGGSSANLLAGTEHPIRSGIKNELEDLEMCDTAAEDVIPVLLYVLYRTGTPLASVVL